MCLLQLISVIIEDCLCPYCGYGDLFLQFCVISVIFGILTVDADVVCVYAPAECHV